MKIFDSGRERWTKNGIAQAKPVFTRIANSVKINCKGTYGKEAYFFPKNLNYNNCALLAKMYTYT